MLTTTPKTQLLDYTIFDFDQIRRKTLILEFTKLCDRFDEIDSTDAGMQLKTSITLEWDFLKTKAQDINSPEELYDLSKAMIISTSLLQLAGVPVPNEQELQAQARHVLSMIKNKAETIAQYMEGMDVN